MKRTVNFTNSRDQYLFQKLQNGRTLSSGSNFLYTVIWYFDWNVPIYCSNSRLSTLGTRLWNVTFLQTFMSLRFLYQVVFYCLVYIVKFDLLYVVCFVFIGVKNHLYFIQLITSLNLTEFKLDLPWSFGKIHYI